MVNDDYKKKSKWYKVTSKKVWFFLTIMTAGLLIPCCIAAFRNLQVKYFIYALNISFLLAILAIEEPPEYLLLLWFMAFVGSLIFRKKLPSKDKPENDFEKKNEINTIESGILEAEEESKNGAAITEIKEEQIGYVSEAVEINPEQDSLIVSSEYEPIEGRASSDDVGVSKSARRVELVSWIIYFFRARRHAKALREVILYEKQMNLRMQDAKEEFEVFIQSFDMNKFSADHEITLLDIHGCGLIEVRKGARVTHRESYSSSSYSGGGVRVGPFGVGGGRGSSSSSSTSISYPAPDELTLIDDGKFIISVLKVSLVGSKFTKTTEFKKLVDFQINGRQILFAPKTGSKVWIVEFPRLAEAIMVSALLGVAFETPERRLDNKASTIYGSVSKAVQANCQRALVEIDLAIEQSEESIAQYVESFKELQELYPAKIEDL